MKGFNKLIIYLILTGLLIILYYFNIFQPLEYKFYDFLMLGRYLWAPEIVNEIAIITIDEDTLSSLGGWPISRKYYARVIRILEDIGVKAIGLDIILSNSYGIEGDKALSTEISKYDNIVLPVVADISMVRGLHGDYITVKGMERPLESFSSKEIGHINFIPDRDGIIRELNLYLSEYPAFSLKLASFHKNLNYVGKRNILINFAGPSNTIPHISFIDLLDRNFKEDLLQGKLVLIGVEAGGLGDRYMTPFARYGYLSGVELHAQALYSLIRGNYLHQLPFSYNFLLLVVMLTIGIIVLYNFPPVKSGLYFLFIILLYTTLFFYLYFYSRLYLQLIPHLIIMGIMYGAGLVDWYLLSEREKRNLIKNLSPYLSIREMGELLKKDPSLVKLGGGRVEVSVIFVDIRNFSSYAEGKEPEEIVSLLNYTFDLINKIIFKYKGTLDKYLGDGIMAFFGAPLLLKEHTRNAVQCAVEIQELSLNNTIPFDLGIGINTGQVLIGNIGSEHRKDYTIIGDVVNKAARFVEIASPGEIIMGEKTFLDLGNYGYTLDYEIKRIYLKGNYNKKITLYRIKGVK